MARKPSFEFERRERDKEKAAKRAEKAKTKAEKKAEDVTPAAAQDGMADEH